MLGRCTSFLAWLANTSQPGILPRAALHCWGAATWVQDVPGSQMSPPSVPQPSPPARHLPRQATWLPCPESSARPLVAVRRHPGWHPGLTPDASPPPAGKTPSSAPSHGLPPGLPPALQQGTCWCTKLPHRQHPNHEVHGAQISPTIPAHPTIMKPCIPKKSRVEEDEGCMMQPVLQ